MGSQRADAFFLLCTEQLPFAITTPFTAVAVALLQSLVSKNTSKLTWTLAQTHCPDGPTACRQGPRYRHSHAMEMLVAPLSHWLRTCAGHWQEYVPGHGWKTSPSLSQRFRVILGKHPGCCCLVGRREVENLVLALIPGHEANRANTPGQPQVIGSSNICSVVYSVS